MAIRQLCVPRLGEDAPLRNIGYLSKRKRLALSRHGVWKGKVVTIQERAATFAEALWQSIANVQVIVRLDNFNKQRFGPNNFELDMSLHTTELAILHTTYLPLFGGQPTLLNLADNVDAGLWHNWMLWCVVLNKYVIKCRGLLYGCRWILRGRMCVVYYGGPS